MFIDVMARCGSELNGNGICGFFDLWVFVGVRTCAVCTIIGIVVS